MIDTNSDTTRDRTGEQDFLPSLRDFFEEHGVALENATGFLGGPRWARRAVQLRCDLSIGALSPRASHREVSAVLALLRAGFVHNTELFASRRSLQSDAADPYAEDIRQLHDRLQSLTTGLLRR